MRAGGLIVTSLLAGSCADARTHGEPETSPAEAVSVAVPPAPSPTASSPAAIVVPAPSGGTSASADAPTEPGTLPIVCEAYFAQFRLCIEASLRKHPDESTRVAVGKQFEQAEQKSRALMTAGMTSRDAETYCKQALVALTTSPCE